MAGIIQNAIDPSTAPTTPDPSLSANKIDSTDANNVYGGATAPVAPTTRSVDAPTETVQGQLTNILNSGSDYMKAARAGAAETSNSRGLLNSSMAASAGEAAAINAAAPIAQADASTYSTVANQNQAYKNQADQFNAGATNASNLKTADAANTAVQQNIKGGQATALADIEANYKTLMQTSSSASTYFAQASKNINDILADPNTSAAQKQSAIDKQTQLLQQQLTVVGAIANVDLTGLLHF